MGRCPTNERFCAFPPTFFHGFIYNQYDNFTQNVYVSVISTVVG